MMNGGRERGRDWWFFVPIFCGIVSCLSKWASKEKTSLHLECETHWFIPDFNCPFDMDWPDGCPFFSSRDPYMKSTLKSFKQHCYDIYLHIQKGTILILQSTWSGPLKKYIGTNINRCCVQCIMRELYKKVF